MKTQRLKGSQSNLPAYEITPLGVEMCQPMKCSCGWAGKKGQCTHRTGSAACPQCGRFVYLPAQRLIPMRANQA